MIAINPANGMIENVIEKLFMDRGLGAVRFPIASVSGGFLHRMFKVETEKGCFALKHLNPNIMKRPEALENFRTAEALESILEAAGLPIVPAIALDGCKMQSCEGKYFYIFRWQNGSITDPNNITIEQCRIAGSIQGKMHAIAPTKTERSEPEASAFNWDKYAKEASKQSCALGKLLDENKGLLEHAQNELNKARAALPAFECIVNEDMDPKNVMWDGGKPYVIDLECLERGNPVISAVRLSLQWAGADIFKLDFAKLKAFFDGYLAYYDNGFRNYSSVFGLAYTWIEWLEYNLKRALFSANDAERDIGAEETKLSLARIKYLYDNEEAVKRQFWLWFEASPKSLPHKPMNTQTDNEISMTAQEMFELAMKHIYGDGVPEDNDLAFELLTKAHEMGHIDAAYNLGICFHYGYGTQIDLAKAYALYLEAANAGHGKGMELVGRFYNRGIFVDKNREKAEFWLKKAVESGDAAAAEEAKKELNFQQND